MITGRRPESGDQEAVKQGKATDPTTYTVTTLTKAADDPLASET